MVSPSSVPHSFLFSFLCAQRLPHSSSLSSLCECAPSSFLVSQLSVRLPHSSSLSSLCAFLIPLLCAPSTSSSSASSLRPSGLPLLCSHSFIFIVRFFWFFFVRFFLILMFIAVSPDTAIFIVLNARFFRFCLCSIPPNPVTAMYIEFFVYFPLEFAFVFPFCCSWE